MNNEDTPVVVDVDKETEEEEHERDPWDIHDDQEAYKKWKDMTATERALFVLGNIAKIILSIACLYLFVCSLSVMGSAFQILAGEAAGEIFTNSKLLFNPIAGLIIGILVTVLVQSSSTSTSIIVSMVASGILKVRSAIPMIMGANIGTSVTNTIVSLAQSMNVDEFRRAFAGATVHDVFNLLSVLILLPLEVIFHDLELMTQAILQDLFKNDTITEEPKLLKVITDPLTKKIVQVNKDTIKDIAKNQTNAGETSILKISCTRYVSQCMPESPLQNSSLLTTMTNSSILEDCQWENVKTKVNCTTQDYIFAQSPISNAWIGVILLATSLLALCVCLLLMVKLLHSMMKGGVAKIVKKVVNSSFPKPFGWLTGYLAIIVGGALTFLVQSSSVFTSAITPLVGIGVISLKRMYPLTLGSNIGTTTTGLLAALTAKSTKQLRLGLQIALCHFFFNIFGIVLWYPIPILRRVPIRGAKILGNTTAKYRWFAVVYLLLVFFIIPAAILGLSFAHIWAMGGVLIFIAAVLVVVIIINILQSKKPEALPQKLQSWEFLPAPMRSLEPYDKVFRKLSFLCKCCKKPNQEEHVVANNGTGEDNKAFQASENVQTSKL
ncbi:sodium-dependent phosphate transport protein 2B-like isoform X2 [Clavelina lepadiformis]|uniref:sodium-dependent phosphate transport protein 2B-like isoform X2 n=1 Tax=Clavelina lepadiformis TaxID=159417 RepID=UPI0040419125